MKSYLIFDEYNSLFNVVDVTDNEISRPYRRGTKGSLKAIVKDEKHLRMLLQENSEIFLFSTNKNNLRILKSHLNTGEYYKRIYRPLQKIGEIMSLSQYIKYKPKIRTTIDEDVYFNSLNQVSFLADSLLKISRVIHFNEDNISTYGNDIRNLIILTCTEIEAQWKGILSANEYGVDKVFFKTNDYIKLLPVLKLNDYSIKFRNFPKLGIISPYENWDPGSPTKSLTWYDAYNKIKHDREKHINLSSIHNLIDAISGLVIMLLAQYGQSILHEGEFKDFFMLVDSPLWKENEAYLPPESLMNSDWKPINYEVK